MAADRSSGRSSPGTAPSRSKIRQLVVDQLCEMSGGPCFYTGRSMEQSHAGMKISAANWDRAVQHLTATLDKFKVPQKEREELFGALGTIRDSIVEP